MKADFEERYVKRLNTSELTCEHNWEEMSDGSDNAVRCNKCYVWGQQREYNGETYVYYPAT